MEIQGPGFGIYDSKYLQVSQRDTARSVKPNVFREVDDSVANALQLTQDVVALSPEAKELMKLIKKYGKNSEQVAKFIKTKNMKDLLYSYKELRDLVLEDEEEDENQDPAKKKKKKNKGMPLTLNQFYIPLSVKGREGGKRSMGWTRSREMLDKMIVFSENDSRKKDLIKELDVMGENIIQMVKSFGVHIIILPRNMNLTQIRIKGMSVVSQGERTFDGRPWEYVRGLYDNSRRLIVIGEENIGLSRSTARHEFAHAFDHTFSEKHGRKLPLSVQVWNLFRKEREGLISQYAGTNPQEYFAEAVEAFFRQNGRDKLMEEDPQMYQYLENLFGPQ